MIKLDAFSNEFIALYNECDVAWGTVYHYTSPNGLLGILQPDGKAKLWFTRYDSLNDTNERQEILPFLQKYCDLQVKKGKISQEFSDAILSIKLSDKHLLAYTEECTPQFSGPSTTRATFKPVECDTYLCCFCDHPDLLPMWNYYTKSQHYEGYSIGFSYPFFTEKIGLKNSFLLEFKQVLYSDEDKTRLLDRLLLETNASDHYTNATNDEKNNLLGLIQGFLNNYQFVFKNAAFQHEREIRAILHIPKDSKQNKSPFTVMYRSSNGYIVPYVELEISSDVIEAITVAPLLQTDISKRNLEEMLKHRGHCSTAVNSSSIPIRF